MNAVKNLVKSARKNFTLEDLIRHEKKRHKNLIEMLSEYPNHGVGFRISKMYWPENHYIKVMRVELETNRLGKVYGKKFVGGTAASDKVFEVDKTTTRGLWNYDLGDSFYISDTGMTYTLEDFKKHYDSCVSKREPKRPKDMRKNMKWTPPEGAIEPIENRNAFN